MPQEPEPDAFDWVSAQSTCSAASMFARLHAGVREDVRRRNAVLGRNDGWTFEFNEDGDAFEVSRLVGSRLTGARVGALVRFECAGRRIQVHGEDVDVDLTAVVMLDPTGVCRWVVGEAMYAEWEIRRMALELLFFEEAEESD